MAQKQQVNVKAELRNDTSKGTLTFQEKKDWSGSVFGDYPEKISINRTDKFEHSGVPPHDLNGSMGGVIYVGPNVQGGPDKCAWLLAWSAVGDDATPNKVCKYKFEFVLSSIDWLARLTLVNIYKYILRQVYVECGDVSQYQKDTTDWDIIRNKLKKSGPKSQSHDSDNTKAGITASIDEDGDSPNLRVTFVVEN